MNIIERKIDELVRRSLEGHTLYALKNRIANYRSEISVLEQKLQAAYEFRGSKDYTDYHDKEYDEARKNLLEAKKQRYNTALTETNSLKDTYQEQLYHSESHVYQIRRRQDTLQDKIQQNEINLDKLTPETEVYNAIGELIKREKGKYKLLADHLTQAQKDEDEKEEQYQTLFAKETFLHDKIAEIDEELAEISARLSGDYVKLCEKAIDTYNIDTLERRIKELRELIEILSQDPEALAREIKSLIAGGNKTDELAVKRKGKELSLISNGGIDTSINEKEHTLTKVVEIPVQSNEMVLGEVEQLGQLFAVTSSDAKDLIIEIRQCKEAYSLCQEACQIVTNKMSKVQDDTDKTEFNKELSIRTVYESHLKELESNLKKLEEQARYFIYNSLLLHEKLDLAKAKYSEILNGHLLTMEDIEKRISDNNDIVLDYLEACVDRSRDRFLPTETTDGVMNEEEENELYHHEYDDTNGFAQEEDETYDANSLFGGFIIDDEPEEESTPEIKNQAEEVKYDYNPDLDIESSLAELDKMFADYPFEETKKEVSEDTNEETPVVSEVQAEEPQEDFDPEVENTPIIEDEIPTVEPVLANYEETPEPEPISEVEDTPIEEPIPVPELPIDEEKQPDEIDFDLPKEKAEKEPDEIDFGIPEEPKAEKQPDEIDFGLPKEEITNPDLPSFDLDAAISALKDNDEEEDSSEGKISLKGLFL